MDTVTYPLSLRAEAPIVRLSNVSKSYGSLKVLDSLCLDIQQNEIVSIIGPSGSGKTTVLRTLMTLDDIDDGVIYVGGKPLTHMDRQGKLVRANPAHLREMRTSI